MEKTSTHHDDVENVDRGPGLQSEQGTDREIQGRAIQQQEHNRGYVETIRKDPRLLF